jgi:nicotinate phosphoribosyltransferase
MQERGQKLAGIRIDSGDLTWLSKLARRMLDEAGLTDAKIVASNDLDEYTIKSILDEGAPIDAWGVGTKLACAYDQPSLGGVYKLSAIKDKASGEWSDRLKISESAAKLTMPGVLNVRRYYAADGMLAGDMVYDVNKDVSTEEIIVDPTDDLRQKKLAGLKWDVLLKPLCINGQVVVDAQDMDAMAAAARAKEALGRLDETQLRMLNPHTYPVGLEVGVHARRQELVRRLRGQDVNRQLA